MKLVVSDKKKNKKKHMKSRKAATDCKVLMKVANRIAH